MINLPKIFGRIEKFLNFPERVKEVLEDDISNFENPEDYKPAEIEIDSRSDKFIQQRLHQFIDWLDEQDEDGLRFEDRIGYGLERFLEGDYYGSTFAFISVQDGLMHWICEEKEIDYDKDEKEEYKPSTKRKTLQKIHQDAFAESEKFVNELWDFYEHRNAIMHGDSRENVYFDRNIAKISMIFLTLTLFDVMTIAEDLEKEN